jgi:rhodanese-related sulfurtransferase
MMQTLLEKRDVSSEELTSLLQAREEGKVDFLLVDVREEMEYNMGHIKGVDMLKPTTAFQQWGQDLFNSTQDKRVIFTCRTGSRSGQIASMFVQNGHKGAINHYGGIMSFRGETEK